jgi:hypothetical protein
MATTKKPGHQLLSECLAELGVEYWPKLDARFKKEGEMRLLTHLVARRDEIIPKEHLAGIHAGISLILDRDYVDAPQLPSAFVAFLIEQVPGGWPHGWMHMKAGRRMTVKTVFTRML